MRCADARDVILAVRGGSSGAVYCLAFWLLTGSYHPSTIAAFLLVEWLCVGVGVYMLRSVRSLDDYAK